MQLLVGVDLRPDSDGALRFSAWLAQALRARGAEATLRGVHVVETDKLRAVEGPDQLAAVEQAAARALADEATRVCAPEDRPHLRLVFDAVAEAALDDLCRDNPTANALVIGRRARLGEDRMVRLGGTARRMLRKLPLPIIVTAPDWDQSLVGAGPVVLATDLGPDVEGAVPWARKLAEGLGRPLLLAHVIGMPDMWENYYSDGSALALATKAMQAEAERSLERWASAHGLDGAAATVRAGHVPSTLHTIAVETRAPLLVLGSRRLSLAARIFLTSVGTELASLSSVAVAIIPLGAGS